MWGHGRLKAISDTYFDTMMWVADGRRSWNRKPKKPRDCRLATLGAVAVRTTSELGDGNSNRRFGTSGADLGWT
jgi:hypothetical protein